MLKGLLNKGLAREQPATPEAASWREDPESGRQMLVIVPAGLEAIGVVKHKAAKVLRKHRKASPAQSRKGKSSRRGNPVETVSVRPGTKLAKIADLLHRNEGATIAEIVGATGWQQHSVRGAISGSLKKRRWACRPHPRRSRDAAASTGSASSLKAAERSTQ